MNIRANLTFFQIYSDMKKLKLYISRINKFISEDVWKMNIGELSKAKAKLVRDTQVVLVALKTFKEQKIGFQSVALSYFCTMAVVPFVAVAFAVTGGFGLAGKLKEILYSSNIDQNIIDMLLNAADNIIKSAQSGVFGLISALMFVWLVIWMMMRVETVFNNVWKVERPQRKFIKSFWVDIIIMILAPFVILIFFTGSIVYSHVLDLIPNKTGITDNIISFLSWIIFCAVAIITLSAMYKFIPATKVRYSCALKAAILSGIVFSILQYLYLETQLMVTRLNAVYGTVAAIPLFMLWLRFGWLIILYGAQFSYSFQKVDEQEKELI